MAEGFAWFQIYRMPRDDLAINMDWIERATAAEVAALVVTIDVPARTKRPRELRNRLVLPYRIGLRTIADVVTRPAWLRAYLRHGQNLFANMQKYVDDNPTAAEAAEFARGEGGGRPSRRSLRRGRTPSSALAVQTSRGRRAVKKKGVKHELHDDGRLDPLHLDRRRHLRARQN